MYLEMKRWVFIFAEKLEKMKKIIIPLILTILLVLTGFVGLFAQVDLSIGWTPVQGVDGGDVEALTKKGDTLFAFTKSAIYSSLDDGDTWAYTQGYVSRDRTLLAENGSVAIFRDSLEFKSGDAVYDTLIEKSKVVFFDGSQPVKTIDELYWLYTDVVVHHFDRKSLFEEPKALNDGSIIYNAYIGHCYYSYPASIEENRYFYHNFQAENFELVSEILGKWGDEWVTTDLPGLSAINYVGTSVGSVDTLYAASANGKMHYTYDGGNTWGIHDIPQGAKSYFMKDGLHLLITQSGAYRSLDGLNFELLPDNVPFYSSERFWIFGDFVIARNPYHWYRSYDKGATWEAFFPKGIMQDKIDGLMTYDDTVYVKAGFHLFQQKCGSDFEQVDTEKPFLLNLNWGEDVVVTPALTIFSKGERHTSQGWQVNSIGVMKQYVLDDSRVFAIPKEKDRVYYSDDEGETWGSILCPGEVLWLDAKGDTLLVGLIGYYSDNPYYTSYYYMAYSVDFGSTWKDYGWDSFDPYVSCLGDSSVSVFHYAYVGLFDDFEGYSESYSIDYTHYQNYYPTIPVAFWDMNDYFMGQWMTTPGYPYRAPLFKRSTSQLFSIDDVPTWMKYRFSKKYLQGVGEQLVRGVDDAVMSKDGTLFVGSKLNGLWRSTPHVTDTAYLETITKHYSTCNLEKEMVIDGVSYLPEHRYMQPKKSLCEPDTLLYIDFVPAIDTVIYLDYCSWWVEYHGESYKPGTYHDVWESTTGCDTSVTIVVTPLVDPVLIHEDYYGWKGNTLTVHGHVSHFPTSFTNIIKSQAGCDSVKYEIELHSLTTSEKLPVIFACANDTIHFDTMDITESDVYYEHVLTSSGFDSIIYEQPIYFMQDYMGVSQTTHFLCAGDSLLVNGLVISEPGSYMVDLLTDVRGCDSLQLVWNVVGPVTLNKSVQVSAGDTVAGVVISQDTFFTEVIASTVYGCDSLVTNYNVQLVVSTQEPAHQKISLFPNPAFDVLHLSWSESTIPFLSIKIKDMRGQTLKTIPKILNGNGIDISFLPQGMYWLELSWEDDFAPMLFQKL